MEVAVHPRGRVVIRLPKIEEMLYDAPAIDKAQPRPLDRNEPLVGLVHRKGFVATVDLAHGAGRCIEEINRSLRSVLQQQQVETTNHLADRKRQRGNLDAVVAFGRRFRREQPRHLDQFAIVTVIKRIEFERIYGVGRMEKLVVAHDGVHVQMRTGEEFARDAATRLLAEAQRSLHDMLHERSEIAAPLRVPHARGVARHIEVVERVKQPVVRHSRNVAHGERDTHIDIVCRIDQRLVMQPGIITIPGVDRKAHVAESDAFEMSRGTTRRGAVLPVTVGSDTTDERLPEEELPLAVARNAVDFDLHMLLASGLHLPDYLPVARNPRSTLGE